MWGGNIAYLCALELLRQSGHARHVVQTILSSREELGSEVLYQAIRKGDLEPAAVGATTEILVGDNGQNALLYRGRTGRVGVDVLFKGEAPHAGEVDRRPAVIGRIAHRYFARGMDELLDDTRGFYMHNPHPDDREGLLPTYLHAIPDSVHGTPDGLSVPGAIRQKFNIFHSDPNLAPERIKAAVEHYFLHNARTPAHALEVRLEERNGVPFTDPWLTPSDHPLALAGARYAQEITGTPMPYVAGSGVAEDGMLRNTRMIGWAPVGAHAHEPGEFVIVESIEERARWLEKLAQHDGDLS